MNHFSLKNYDLSLFIKKGYRISYESFLLKNYHQWEIFYYVGKDIYWHFIDDEKCAHHFKSNKR